MKIDEIVREAESIKGTIAAVTPTTISVTNQQNGTTLDIPNANLQQDPNTPNGTIATANPVTPKPGAAITVLPSSDSTAIAEKDRHNTPIGGDATDDWITDISYDDDQDPDDDQVPDDDQETDGFDELKHIMKLLQL